jgi:nucleoid DNA-binding protein
MSAGREDLVRALRDGAGLTLRDAATCIDVVIDWMAESLAAGETIELRGLGTFAVTKVAGSKMACTNKTVPAHGRVLFRPAMKLKKSVWARG